MTSNIQSKVDLHCHSTASDGLLTPSELARHAGERGLAVIALTDHDSVSGIREAQAAGYHVGLEVIAGVELSSEVDGLQAHILGYFIDPDSEILKREFEWMNESRRLRIERICHQLNQAGIGVEVDRVFALAGNGTVGRPHVARAMVDQGIVQSVTEAFSGYLKRGRPGYVQSKKIGPERAIEVIANAGGVAVLAHPWSTGHPEAAVQRLRLAGLGGLEAYYGEYTPQVRAALAELAAANDLIATGGSDFHGKGMKPIGLGEVWVPPLAVDQLRAAAMRNVATLASNSE